MWVTIYTVLIFLLAYFDIILLQKTQQKNLLLFGGCALIFIIVRVIIFIVTFPPKLNIPQISEIGEKIGITVDLFTKILGLPIPNFFAIAGNIYDQLITLKRKEAHQKRASERLKAILITVISIILSLISTIVCGYLIFKKIL
ncbi:MAG: hypothetical protein HQK79_14630 [Desulfobacterales bacterium]|nr:hypothetical protein [Desulfobacterales bacterium]MBF0398797.1 hypothetical protein [Desulfobacterales bacterium]